MKSGSWMAVAQTFFPYLRKQKPLICGSLAALLLATAMRLLEPWPLAFVIDTVLTNVAKGKVTGKVPIGADWSIETWLLFCAGSVIVIAALKAMMSYFSTLGLAMAGSRVLSEVRRDLFAHLQRLSLTFHRSAKTGDLTMRLINDIGMLREVTVTAMMPMLASLLILTGMFGVMLFLDWQLTLIALLPMPLLLWSTRRTSKKIHEVSRAQRKREGSMAGKAAEFMGGIATVQALSLESAAIKNFAGDDVQSMQQNVRSKRLSAGLERKVDMIIAFATALVLLQGANDVLDGEMSPGDLLIFLSYLKNSFRPVREYAKYTGRLSKAMAAGERVVDLLKLQPEIADGKDAIGIKQAFGEICFDRVQFGYQNEGRGKNILNDVSFYIPAKGSLALVGPSGAGKSTASSLLLRLYDPRSGRITLDGVDIRDYTVKSVRAQMGFVPQESLLFGVSIRENIALAAQREVTDNEIIAAAMLANAHDFIMELPQGYDTILSERGNSLSGGQRQRISIARAAIRQNPVLILDEPSVGLDSENEHFVIEALLRLMQGRTSLLITHNLAFASRADRILFLEAGQVVEQGSHNELMAMNGRYAELWRLQGWQG